MVLECSDDMMSAVLETEDFLYEDIKDMPSGFEV